MKKKICLIFSLFLICVFSLTPVYASDIDLYDMNIHVDIHEDGSALIREKWEIDVNEGTEIYKVFNRMDESKIINFSVQDEKGTVYQNIGEWDSRATKSHKDNKCGIMTKNNGYELCFGIGDYGKREYIFSYEMTHFIKQYKHDQGFNFAFFSDLSLEPQHVKIELSSPYFFDKDNSQIWAFGYHGRVDFMNGKVVMETDESVPKNGKMQLLMRIDNGTFQNAYPVDEDFDDIYNDAIEDSDYDEEMSPLQKIMLVIGMITGIVIIGLLIGYLVKSNKVKMIFSDNIPLKTMKDVNMFRDIPCHKNIFEFYYLAKKCELIDDGKDGLIAAVLLRWIQKGYIEFEKTEESHLLFFKKEGYSIDLNKEISLQNDLELKLMGFIRNAAGSNHKLETDEFEKWCSQHYDEIEEWFEDVEESLERNYRNNGLLKLGVTHIKYMGMKLKKDVDMYDASLREEMHHIMGLKKFLEEMSLIDEKEVIEVKMWEEYLIFASILGIADKVQEQLGRLCPTFNEQSDLDTIYTMRMVHMFSHNSMRAVSSAQAARTQGHGGNSSFTGGGGGFSGGGGGGVR